MRFEETDGILRPSTAWMISIGVSPWNGGLPVSKVQNSTPNPYISVLEFGSAGMRPVCSGAIYWSLYLTPTSRDKVIHPLLVKPFSNDRGPEPKFISLTTQVSWLKWKASGLSSPCTVLNP